MPVSAPDGRTIPLEVRDGEQHDLVRFTAEWVSAERVAADTAEQIAAAALARLGEVLVAMPVDVPGRARLTLHIRHRDAEVGRRSFTPNSTRVDRAWFQRLTLECDAVLSNLTIGCTPRPCIAPWRHSAR